MIDRYYIHNPSPAGTCHQSWCASSRGSRAFNRRAVWYIASRASLLWWSVCLHGGDFGFCSAFRAEEKTMKVTGRVNGILISGKWSIACWIFWKSRLEKLTNLFWRTGVFGGFSENMIRIWPCDTSDRLLFLNKYEQLNLIPYTTENFDEMEKIIFFN